MSKKFNNLEREIEFFETIDTKQFLNLQKKKKTSSFKYVLMILSSYLVFNTACVESKNSVYADLNQQINNFSISPALSDDFVSNKFNQFDSLEKVVNNSVTKEDLKTIEILLNNHDIPQEERKIIAMKALEYIDTEIHSLYPEVIYYLENRSLINLSRIEQDQIYLTYVKQKVLEKYGKIWLNAYSTLESSGNNYDYINEKTNYLLNKESIFSKMGKI